MQMILYGSGHRSGILIDLIEGTDLLIEKVIDSNSEKWGMEIKNYVIESPECLYYCKNTYVCVTFFGENDYEPIWDELSKKFGIDKEWILSFHDVIKLIYQKNMINRESNFFGKEWTSIFDGAWNFNIGGVESWIQSTVSELIKMDRRVFLLTSAEQKFENKDLYNRIIDFKMSSSCNFKSDDVEKAITMLLDCIPCTVVLSRVDEVMLAAHLIKQNNPDSIRLITVVHGACDGLVRDIVSYDESIECYMCVSMAAQNAIINVGGKKERCELITSPIFHEMEKEKKYTLDLNAPLKIGYVGRIEVFHKRADLLLRLIEDLEQLGVNYVFQIVGDGTYIHELIEFIFKKGLFNKVVYKGTKKRNEIFDFWEENDISINISDSEGRPMSNMEAMFCGAVPIVTATEGILEDVEDGITGFVVDKGDHWSMAKRISYLDQNRIWLQEIGSKARESMKAKTDITKYSRKWIELLSVG